ncbi:MAG TPA: ABC transporter permease [Acidobacteriaceae bacterium]|jgi:predicted permease|nr:ABC transporter permease [Acidobacteriaceae bacterium]
MGKLLNDVQYALRQFRRNPGFAITAALTLSLGIGATTAIFTLIYNTMLKALPVQHASKLYMVGKEPTCCNYGGLQGDEWRIFSNDLYLYFRDHTKGFESLTAFQSFSTPLLTRRVGDPHPPDTVPGRFVAGNEFSTLGVPLALGRPIQPSDDTEGAPPVAVISYRMWQRRLGLDPHILGTNFTMNGVVVTVVGVTAPEYKGEIVQSDPPELWLALNQEAKFTGADAAHTHHLDTHWLDVVGRIAPDASLDQITAQLNVELRQWLSSRDTLDAAARAQIDRQKTQLSSARTGVNDVAEGYGRGLKMLMAAAGFVLLIVCANVANLLLVRATAERQQQAVRIALGATRGQLVRQAMISSILLALVGGAGAVAIAYAVAHSVLRLAFRGSEYVPIEVNPSLPVLGFAVLAALVTAILCAAIPAWISTKTDPASAIRGTSRTMKDSSSAPQRVLVITQAALSVVLLCAAGLLLRSLNNLRTQDFGFHTEDRYIVGIDPFLAGYKPEQTDDLYRKLHERLMRIPGTKKVAFALYTPLSHDNWNGGIFIPGQPDPKPDSNWYSATYIRITPEYFDAIGAKLRTGRFFSDGDDNHGRKVAIVNQVFADRYFHGKAIGQHFGVERELESQFEIVGIVENTKHQDPNVPPPPMYYLPFAQATAVAKPQDKVFEPLGHYAGQVVMDTASTTPAALEEATRHAFADVNPLLTPQYFRTFSAQVATNFNQDELLARLTSLFGLVALILASIGLYGVTAYSVERRTGEIGVRMALGADRASILRDVLKRALTHCVLGLAIGVPLAYAAGRLMAQHLYGVGAFDASVAIVTLFMLSIAAAVAALVPARRAASIEPMVALRME